jgi:type IV pilus assembly protein PilW
MNSARSAAAGLTLIELMIALAIGSVTLLGAVRLYAHAATIIRTGQSVQALEEAAQLALGALRRDIELAGFFGFIRRDPTDPFAAVAIPMLAVRNDCGANWAIRIDQPITGSDNVYDWRCRAYAGLPLPGADTLVLRYAGPRQSDALESGRVYLRTDATGRGEIFAARGAGAVPEQPLTMTHALQVRGYYVSRTSAGDVSQSLTPSLRVKHLSERGGRASVIDEEIQPGIEDLQVEFATANDRFIGAAELAADDRIRAIRIWLLVRSPFRENGLGTYSIPAFAGRPLRRFSDGYRRRLVTTTIRIGHDHPL